MSSTSPESPSRAPDFAEPLGVLAAFDRDSRRECAALLRLRARVAASGADAAASDAARGIIDFFDNATDHQADEEAYLFPALMEAMAGSDPVCIRELAEMLADEHREFARLWRPVRQWLYAVESGAPGLPDARPVDAFAELCERHASREELELYPMAERLLDAEALDRIGRSMRRRRDLR